MQRPLTRRDLLKSSSWMDAEVTRVAITDLRNDTFAQISLRADGRRIEIDSRPGDAIALAVL